MNERLALHRKDLEKYHRTKRSLCLYVQCNLWEGGTLTSFLFWDSQNSPRNNYPEKDSRKVDFSQIGGHTHLHLGCHVYTYSPSMLFAGHFFILLGGPNAHVTKAQYKREGELLNKEVIELIVLDTVIYSVSSSKSFPENSRRKIYGN